jgi:SPX domain protein involved in polyphosphate accumulation
LETLLQRSRYELKYLINEELALTVRDFARTYLAPDPFTDETKGFSYPIYSVYLDSARLDLLNATVEGHKNRFKLRARYYDGNPESPIFFEIKRRVNGAILKERAKVRRTEAARLLEGGFPERADLVNEADAHAYAALRRFCELRDKLNAKPRCIVVYNREAWLTPDNNSARLTIDRNLEGGPYEPAMTTERTPEWVRPPIGGVVLELKFTDRFPNWMREMTRLFDLQRCSMAKYVKCVHSMQPWRREEARLARLNRVAAL